MSFAFIFCFPIHFIMVIRLGVVDFGVRLYRCGVAVGFGLNFFFFFFGREFQSMAFVSDDNFLSSDQDTNKFLV